MAELGESPLWTADTGLRWLDVPGRQLHTLDLEGRHQCVPLSARITAVELGPEEDLLAVTSTGFGWLDPGSGHVEQFAEIVAAPVSMNDGGIDPRGRAWAGSAVRDGSRRGALYRLDGRGVTTHLEKLSMSNGIDWSPDGDELYHVDSTAGTVTAWQFHLDSGELDMPRLLRRIPEETGLPDGLTVDGNGDLWLALWGAGQVWRLDRETGETTAIVEVPVPCPTSCAFGGRDLSTLYITTANSGDAVGGGLLHAVDVPVRGLLPHRFSGGVPCV
ncbi:sugar lactone lactonase YvrE [Amycolatopsis bartoniae]|uniref:SMP-30/gluconolactonase/LRE family protein n=1 Tax=Amycolatopsis bartoniae TaxID=941986 RepID=UPI001643BB37|nr:SMP-30/gluconolactonase/LRE family protein [Amycolatopsis bartoniae]MBB2933595.1 sugar lactone lactonase YvrE [Amycolatopsis bartoniae]